MEGEEPSAKMLVCSHCPKEFRYNSERKRHELSHFPHFECETCSKKFSFVSALRRHQKQHERTGNVKCKECHRKFRDDVLLKRHMKYAHKGTYNCEKCNSKFSSELALRTHMKIHKPVSERRFKCSHAGCTKSFNFSHHLKHHELTHTNAKPHHCSLCGKGFIQSHHLKSHLKTHDQGVWLVCETRGCGKKFYTDYARKRHMATHRNKPDSGISSDSNSWDTSNASKYLVEESILGATCGETLPHDESKTHSADFIKKEPCTNHHIMVEIANFPIEQWPCSPCKPSASEEDDKKTITLKQTTEDIGCNMLLVSPINENDLMPKISNVDSSEIKIDVSRNNITANVHYIENNDNETAESPKSLIVKMNPLTDFNDNERDMCEGCDCANICNDKISMYLTLDVAVDKLQNIKKESAVQNIEYRNDGVIKIKDTFDDDIVLKREEDDSKRLFPFSTCKDVVGNCLVSGGDGCLCARMMADGDQASMAQEIEDITPHPKTEPT